MANLKAVAQGAVAAAMAVVGDARAAGVLKSGQANVYNSDTDATVQSGGTTRTIRGVLYRDIQTQGRDVPGTTASFVMEAVLSPASLDEADTLTVKGEVWQIVAVEPDPLDATKILRLRK